MCLLFFYVNKFPKAGEFKLILANNRDEFYSRPTEAAHVWNTDPKLISGKDIEPGKEGGTWLGASENGKIACLLNIFQPIEEYVNRQGAGRGFLAVDFLLKKDLSGSDYIQTLVESKAIYYPFNLVLLEMHDDQFEAVSYSSKDPDSSPKKLESGTVWGFGNCLTARPFNKVVKGKEEMQKVIAKYGTKDQEDHLLEALFSLMRTEEYFYPDEVLQEQGKGHSESMIHGLSSIWVAIPEKKYGTRTTTVITVDADNELTFHERTMKAPSASCTDFEKHDFCFRLG